MKRPAGPSARKQRRAPPRPPNLAAPPRQPGLRERKKQDKRERIHAAALRIFRRDGFEGATTRAIAREAKVAMGTLFRYMRDKRQMLLQVLHADLDALTEEGCAAALNGRGSLVARIVAFYRPRFVYFHTYPDIGRHFLTETFLAGGSPARPEARRSRSRREQMIAQLATIIAAHRGRRLASDTMSARMIHALYLTAARQWLEQPHPPLKDGIAQLRALVNAAVGGLR